MKKKWNDFLKRMLQDGIWNIRRLVDDSFVPANQRISESAHYIEDCRILRPYDIANVCSAEKLTKHSTVLLLCMVSFSEEQTLLHSSIKEWEKKSNEYSIDFKTRLNMVIDVYCVTLLDISKRVEIFRFSDCRITTMCPKPLRS